MVQKNAGREKTVDSPVEWFWMLVNYMKIKTLELWFRLYPQSSLESFELLWPRFFENMLSHATNATSQKLHAMVIINDN